jgi:gliding motility-associated protein GldC
MAEIFHVVFFVVKIHGFTSFHKHDLVKYACCSKESLISCQKVPCNMSKQSDIHIHIELDEDQLPQKISWQATDSSSNELQDSKAFMLSLWDPHYKETLRMDLWTKEMQLEEMNVFVFQTLLTMSDTYKRANNDEKLANEIREFALHFGEKTAVIKRQK